MRTFACRRCGQVIAQCDTCPAPASASWCPCGRDLCARCAGPQDPPRHETLRLFAPAPDQIPGQLDLPGT